MKMIVEIPNALYSNLKKIQNGSIATKRILDCVRNGTPLSESEDCVSRQALDDILDKWAWGDIKTDDLNEKIKALPPVTPAEKQEPCDDCIRREDALMALTGEYTDSPIEILPKAIKRINKLPPVTPAEKVGQWIYDRIKDWDGECKYECSECGMGSDVDYAYCMRCGRKMQEVDVPDNNVGEMGGEQE